MLKLLPVGICAALSEYEHMNTCRTLNGHNFVTIYLIYYL